MRGIVDVTQDKIVPPDAITPAEKRQTLHRLTQVIQYRLVASDLPQQMRKLKVGKSKSGRDLTQVGLGKVVETFKVTYTGISFSDEEQLRSPYQLFKA